MGSFYTNVTLRGPEQPQVAEYLASRNRQTIVSPTVEGVTVVYDAITESQDPDTLTSLGRELSAQLDCPALAALCHDDDVLWLQLHVDGRLVDEYDSTPGYFDGTPAGGPEGGDAEALCAAFGAGGRAGEVEDILRRGPDFVGYTFAPQRHKALASALGIPPALVTAGYDYLTRGEVPAGFNPAHFVHTGPPPQPLAQPAGPWGPMAGPGGPGVPGGPQASPPPGVGHIHIGPTPGAGCCGCLVAPLLLPLVGLWSALVLRRSGTINEE